VTKSAMPTNRLRFAVLASLLALAASTAQAADQIVIKFSHVTTSDTPKGKAADRFKKLAEERTGGRVQVQVYPNSTLYKDKEELQALQLGSVQMLAPSLSTFGKIGVKDFDAFELPYLFADYNDVHKITLGPIGQQMFKNLEAHNITGLAFLDNGFREMHANKPLKTPADFRGLKMRTNASKITEATFRSVGALPQNLAFSEVYQALDTHLVDGGENTASNIFTQKFHEVQKFITLTDHGYLGYAVVTNKKFWDGLPPDIRQILDGAIKDAAKYNNDIAKKENDDALAGIRKNGHATIVTITPQEKAALRKVMLPVHKSEEDRIGKDVMQRIYKEIGFAAN
jgi:C4-dicarboxylate-binding protein DctP